MSTRFILLGEFMEIKINVKNSSVDFSNQKINLDKLGVYHVVGPNGIGKTTILKDIVFSKKFADDNRNHFSYIEQDPEKYDISIEKYIERYNTEIDFKLMAELIEKFDLSHLRMKDSLNVVSGGELVKLNIISGLIKKTDFIFLDEPTNNLDDSSVKILKEIVYDISLKKIVVVVSHDVRFKFENSHTITVRENGVELEYFDQISELDEKRSTSDLKRIKYPYGKIIFRHLLRPSTIVSILLMFFYFLPIFCANYIAFLSLYIYEEPAKQDDSLLVYYGDGEYGEINQIFAEFMDMTVDEEKYNSLIKYSDISTIANNPLVEEIYIANYINWISLWDNFHGDSLSQPVTVSIPGKILDNYMEQICPYFSGMYLVSGRNPRDGKNEIALSQGLIDSMYSGKGINDTILFEGKEYTIVGIQYYDFFVISYSGESDLYYKYDPDTYEDFVNEQIKYKKEHYMFDIYVYKPDDLTIKAKSGKEEELLLELFLEYPANNYRSHSYDVHYADFLNGKLIKTAAIVNVVAGSIIGVLFMLVNRKRRNIYLTEARSMDNYYLTKGKTTRMYAVLEILISILIYIAYALLSIIFSKYDVQSYVTILCFTILTVFSIFPHVIILLKNKKND